MQSNEDEYIQEINPIDDLDYEDPTLKDDICYIDEHVSVMRYILCTPIDTDSWKHTSIFHTLIYLNGKTCKLVIDGGNTMNVISWSTLSTLKLKPKSHLCPFKVSWVDKTSLPIKDRCLVHLKINSYYEDL